MTSVITSPKEIVMLGYEGSPSQRLMNWVPQLVVLFSEGLETSGGGNFLGGRKSLAVSTWGNPVSGTFLFLSLLPIGRELTKPLCLKPSSL